MASRKAGPFTVHVQVLLALVGAIGAISGISLPSDKDATKSAAKLPAAKLQWSFTSQCWWEPTPPMKDWPVVPNL